MDKEEYQKALKSPKWIIKRNRIKKRDKNKCTKCGSKKSLHVHHTYYLKGKMPWDVPDDCLITLCKICHKKEHDGKDIGTFMRISPPKNNIKPSKKVKNKKASPEKIKKLRYYKFMAIKSSSIKQIFDKSTNWKQVERPCDCLVKGFDNLKLAEKWLNE